MKKQEMLDSIGSMLSEMYPSIIEADAKRLVLKKEPNYEQVLKGYNWIKKIYENQFARVQDTRKLLPDFLWERYKSWGDFDDHQECIILRRNLQSLKDAISHERPKLFLTKRQTAKKQGSGASESNSTDGGESAETD